MPGFRHGFVCSCLVFAVDCYVRQHNVGRVICNDSGVITTRNPDSVRGMDVAFCSYARLPREVMPVGYPDVVPEVIFEVLSPSDRPSQILAKVAEYLAAGVGQVCVVDPETQTVRLYYDDRPEKLLSVDEELTFLPPLENLRIPVRRLFAG